MKTCKAFRMENREECFEHLSHLKKIREFGDSCNGHDLYTWDEGHRYLCVCPLCHALVLVQSSEFHGFEDDYYKDYFAVDCVQTALALNEKYDGWQIETQYRGKKIFQSF